MGSGIMGLIATVELESTAAYSPSRKHNAPKKTKEGPDAYDTRTWREHAHCDEDGNVLIPSMAFKFAMMSAAAYLGEKIPGKGSKTWTGYITAATFIAHDLRLPLKVADLQPITINAHAGGKRTDAKRVDRTYPLIPSWKGTIEVHVLDETITREVFEKIMQYAGSFVGIGRFRPQNGGFNGRFRVVKITWRKIDE